MLVASATAFPRPPSPSCFCLPFPNRVFPPYFSVVPTPRMRGYVWQHRVVLTIIIRIIPSVVLCRPHTHVFSSIPSGILVAESAVEGYSRANGLPSLAGVPV